jgi:formylglycine-generating enzyme required for sulfatase activity
MHKSFLYFLVYLVLSVSAIAAPPKEALLIANGKYSHFAGLAHPAPDAAKLSAVLEHLGFRVRVVRDGNREQMLDAISEFERGLRNTGAIAFFHYGGHGVQVDGKNYLLPADADIPDERRVATRAVALDEVMTAMDAAAARASIIVIDACRDNPLPAGSSRNLARGLSVVGMKPKNSMVIYAAEAGSKALDGLFTPILASSLQQKGRSINQIMMSVRSEVYAKSSGQQTPGEYNQLFEELFLGEPGDNLTPENVFATKPASGLKDDMVRVEGGTLPDASEFAGKSVKSFYIGRTEVTWMEWKKVRIWASDHGYDIGSAGSGSGNDHPVQNVSWYDCLKWCNAKSEMEGLEPVYEVKGMVYRSRDYGDKGSSLVSQNSRANGYRLPREWEWEWAARGGSESRGYKYSGSDDLSSVGWYRGNSQAAAEDLGSRVMEKFSDLFKSWSGKQKKGLQGSGTWPVGKNGRNELGLLDMCGNVGEWCWDRLDGIETQTSGIEMSPLDGSFRRVRGGSWYDAADDCALDYKGLYLSPLSIDCYHGLRLARNLDQPICDETLIEALMEEIRRLVEDSDKAFRIGDYDAGMAKIQEADTLLPNDPGVMLRIGRLQEKKGDIAAAEETYKKVLALSDLSTEIRAQTQRKLGMLGTPLASWKIIETHLSELPKGAKTLRISTKPGSDQKIDPCKMQLHLYFYERDRTGQIQLTKSQVVTEWTSPPIDWSNNEPELLNATYKPAANSKSSYAGYVTGVYYEGILQDLRADPEALAGEHPLPLSLAR